MAAIQMIDLLKKGEAFHQNLAAYYEQVSHDVDREDVRIILDYMSRHEEYLGHCFEDYEKHAPKAVAEHWFKWVPDTNFAKIMEQASIPHDATVEDVIRLARHFDDCLIQLYQQLVEMSPPGLLRDALGKLLEMEQQQEKLMVRNLQQW